MGKSRFFYVVLAGFLTVTAFLVGYEVKPAPGADPSGAVIESPGQPASLRHMMAEVGGFSPRPQGSSRTGGGSLSDPVFSFSDVLQLLNDKYVDELEDEDKQKLTYGAIRGMLRELGDPYTRFMEPKDFQEFQYESQGEFDGIGALLGIERETGLITIVATFEENPAHEAGLQPGDYIKGVDGQSTEDMSLDVAVSKIRGKAGTPVLLTIQRPERIEPWEQEVQVTTEGQITIPSEALAKAQLQSDEKLMLRVDGHRMVVYPQQQMMEDKPTLDIKVTRGTIKIPVAQKKLLCDHCGSELSDPELTCSDCENALSAAPGRIGYVWLQVFNEKSEQQLDEAMAELREQGIQGFILDLRYDPGGLLDMAVIVASKFIRSGPVVFVKERGKENPDELRALPQEYKDLQVPLVVLVNKFSASASEIVAGAIQDYGVGTIIGVPTFGKSSVQTVVPLNDRSAVAITTAKYLTPKMRDIGKKGIEPDIQVEIPEDFRPSQDPLQEDTQLQEAIREIQRKRAPTAPGPAGEEAPDGS